MARRQNPNLQILEMAVEQLGVLANEMVFLGGCATGLLITDPAAPPIRVTRDVDAIVQVSSRADYYQLSDKLRERGFREDTSDGAPICRWTHGNLILDIMPTDSRILGFSNKWYTAASKHTEIVKLPSGKEIQMVSAPYFLITKLEAFDGRGHGDYLLSHDIEDIIAVVDGRRELLDEIKNADLALVHELSERFKKLIHDDRFIDSVSGHMPTDETSQARVHISLEILTGISELS